MFITYILKKSIFSIGSNLIISKKKLFHTKENNFNFVIYFPITIDIPINCNTNKLIYYNRLPTERSLMA